MDRFERDLGRKIGVGHVTATHTGTAALHLALLALEMRRGARVLLPTYVCAAVLHAIRYVGAKPVLVDVDPDTANIDPADAKRKARGAAAIVVPHMFGLPAPVDDLLALGVPVIEDCAMAVGATYRNRPVGSYGRLSVFSFYATKMLATGHGGAVATADRSLAARIRDLVEYDNRDEDRVRHNYRMSALAAALGRAQLRRTAEFVKARRAIADFYYARLDGLPVRLPPSGRQAYANLPMRSGPPRAGHVYYRFVVRAGSRLAGHLRSRGIEAKRPVYRPLHMYGSARSGAFPGAEELHRSAVSLPIYPSLSRTNQRRIASAVAASASVLA